MIVNMQIWMHQNKHSPSKNIIFFARKALDVKGLKLYCLSVTWKWDRMWCLWVSPQHATVTCICWPAVYCTWNMPTNSSIHVTTSLFWIPLLWKMKRWQRSKNIAFSYGVNCRQDTILIYPTNENPLWALLKHFIDFSFIRAAEFPTLTEVYWPWFVVQISNKVTTKEKWYSG